MCGSGMRAAMFAHDMLLAGSHEVLVAGGMESMTNAPYVLPKARGGYRIGHDRIFDHMMLDGLEDAYEPGRSMGTFGEDCAAKYSFTREQQDAFATRQCAAAPKQPPKAVRLPLKLPPSRSRAGGVKPWSVHRRRSGQDQARQAAHTQARVQKRRHHHRGQQLQHQRRCGRAGHDACQHRRQVRLQAACKNSRTRHPRARAQWFATAPVGASEKALAKAGWAVGDVDLWEINEAFAVVPMALMHDMNVPHDKVNVNGGACALGHPIGASGARIMVTLIHALKARGLTKGMATLCIGGGEATAVALEVL
jgi:acetyl-CoA C-acetyltransferase